MSAIQELTLKSKYSTVAVTLDRGEWQRAMREVLGNMSTWDISFVTIQSDLYQYFLRLTQSSKSSKLNTIHSRSYITPLGRYPLNL